MTTIDLMGVHYAHNGRVKLLTILKRHYVLDYVDILVLLDDGGCARPRLDPKVTSYYKDLL